jgi:hypothetical protein
MPHAALYNNRSCVINETADRRPPYVARHHPRKTPRCELDVEGQIGWDRRSLDQSETTIRHSAASQDHTKIERCLEWAPWGGQRSGR